MPFKTRRSSRTHRPSARITPAKVGTRSPRTNLAQWTFSIEGEIETPHRWTWDEFLAVRAETITRDIHCLTKWSKFDTLDALGR